MASGPESIAELLNLFRRELGVFHVSQVRFVMRLPLVEIGEEILRELQSQSNEMV